MIYATLVQDLSANQSAFAKKTQTSNKKKNTVASRIHQFCLNVWDIVFLFHTFLVVGAKYVVESKKVSVF
jgi:hypothetical protein